MIEPVSSDDSKALMVKSSSFVKTNCKTSKNKAWSELKLKAKGLFQRRRSRSPKRELVLAQTS